MLELAVIGLLKEQPLHGYELKKRLSDTLGFLWGVSYGSLYPALRRLERAGAIEVVEAAGDEIPAAQIFVGRLGAEKSYRHHDQFRKSRCQSAPVDSELLVYLGTIRIE